MRSFEFELPAETAESVEVEADLLGFDTPGSYVRWVVSRRFAIDDGSQLSATLEEYASRVRELDDSGDRETLLEAASRADDAARRLESESDRTDGTSPTDRTDGDGRADGTGGDSGADRTDRAQHHHRNRNRSRDAGGDGDGNQSLESPTEGLEEGTVDRIEDRNLDEAAAALSNVEKSRVDTFARRALNKTREQLGDDVETGIDYSARGGVDDAPLGSEITDLDAIEVPGHDEDLITQRRLAVGAALALLKDAETAQRSDFVETLYEEYPAGYQTADSWWACIKRGLRQVDRVKPAGEGSRIWGFRTTPGRVRRISYS
jgi:hypothetical protein